VPPESGPPARYPSLAGRRIVVTGGATGIGEALVEGFAAQGAEVCFLDVQAAESRALADRLETAPHPPRFHRCDLTDPAEIERTFAAIGPVDVLVNNAGNDDRHALDAVTAEYFDARIAVNLRHYVLCARAVVPHMKAAGRGVIINLGSIAWHLGLPDLSVYEAAKAAAEGLTRGLSRELGPAGVRVVCIAPGSVRTPRQLKWYPTPESEAEILANQAMKGRIEPRDVAALALFLASDDARYCTGHTYFVDAGWA
jgi:NAD(P)-dependent dehydrogenase (short-subunit alcohol dehydrogenase family)